MSKRDIINKNFVIKNYYNSCDGLISHPFQKIISNPPKETELLVWFPQNDLSS